MSFDFQSNKSTKKQGGIYKKPQYGKYWDISTAEDSEVIDIDGNILPKVSKMNIIAAAKITELNFKGADSSVYLYGFEDGRVCLLIQKHANKYGKEFIQAIWLDNKSTSKGVDFMNVIDIF